MEKLCYADTDCLGESRAALAGYWHSGMMTPIDMASSVALALTPILTDLEVGSTAG
jgi:hypothetical protein